MLEVTMRPRVTVDMSYVGDCDWQCHVYLWVYKAVVCAVHTWIIFWAHPGFTLLCKASAASVTISTGLIFDACSCTVQTRSSRKRAVSSNSKFKMPLEHFKIMNCLAPQLVLWLLWWTVPCMTVLSFSTARYCVLCKVCYFDYAVCHSRRVAKSCEKVPNRRKIRKIESLNGEKSIPGNYNLIAPHSLTS